MLTSIISTLFVLPLLLLFSIPLVLSACLTITLAAITLLVRVSMVYVELAGALLMDFFSSVNDDSAFYFSEENACTPGGSPQVSSSFLLLSIF